MRSISRRKAIKTGIATATAAIFTEGLPKSLWAKPLVTSPGIQLYTVDKELKADVEGTLKKVKAIGYEEVEAAGFAGLSAKQFRAALDGAGLNCASTHFFDFGGSDPGHLLEEANALGVHYTVSSMMGNFPNKPSGEMGVEGYKALADYCNQLAGYCVVNDLSERAFQLEGTGRWTKGKSADTFGPIGPWLVTPDEVPDPQNLSMWLEKDGKRYQDGSTRTMVFGVAHLISYLSRFVSLQPGDIISTGTPPGVGMAQKPPIFLKPGSRIRLGIEGLGEQNQLVISDPGETDTRHTLTMERN
ncbi:MAG: hypothetical protein QOJ51_2315 [Acidobacteriaceae bacterium]|nr:hypothetical protein [Acidobacteriaceae bacterium]